MGIYQWFSTGDKFGPQWTFKNVGFGCHNRRGLLLTRNAPKHFTVHCTVPPAPSKKQPKCQQSQSSEALLYSQPPHSCVLSSSVARLILYVLSPRIKLSTYHFISKAFRRDKASLKNVILILCHNFLISDIQLAMFRFPQFCFFLKNTLFKLESILGPCIIDA